MLKVQIGKGFNAPFTLIVDVKRLFREELPEFRFVGDIKIVGEVVPNRARYLVEGKIYCTREFICDRCLSQATEDQIVDFDEEVTAADIEDGFVDLKDIVRDNLIAAQPIKNLCNPNCEGIIF